MVNTISDGSFMAVWQPDVTGNYLIKATFEETSTMNGASKTVNLALTPDAEQNVFTLTSNSTITQFAFNSTTSQLSFIASGPSGTQGYVNICVPKTLISDVSQLKAYVDGSQVSFNSESQIDSWLISFTYSHSQHRITMTVDSPIVVTDNGSSPQWLFYAVPIALVVGIAVVVLVFKSRSKTP
ncbi:MAG: hypothetical protein M1167_05960 [Chloroflexi bacterium]|nr:hypothetical protein [Chloroflexota bacterium]